jgi:hypothetical protein
MFCVYAICACERYQVSFKRNASMAVELGLSAMQDALFSLSQDIADHKVPIAGNPLVDHIFYKARYTLLLALESLLWFWCEAVGWPTEEKKSQVESFLLTEHRNLYFWV